MPNTHRVRFGVNAAIFVNQWPRSETGYESKCRSCKLIEFLAVERNLLEVKKTSDVSVRNDFEIQQEK